MRKVYRVFWGIFVTIFVLTSIVACSFDESKNHLSGGQLLDDEKMSEIKKELLSDIPSEIETTESDGTNSDDTPVQESTTSVEGETDSVDNSAESSNENGNKDEISNKVYWTKSGSVWHTTSECRYLSKSTNILSGSIDEAKEAGKAKACSGCGK